MNDVVLEDKFEENSSVQIETSRNLENGSEKIIKKNLKKLHAQRKIWKPHGRTSLCWSFYCVNDNAKVDLINTQIMHCVLCYQNPVIRINPRIQARKGLISYYKTNGITSPMEEMNSLLKRIEEKQPSKKRTNSSRRSISKFFQRHL
jgi:hypothetical protein